MRYVKLSLTNGEKYLVFRPSTLGTVSDRCIMLHSEVSAWMQLIMTEAIEIAQLESIDLTDIEGADDRLQEVLSPYYQKVLNLLTGGELSSTRINKRDRHEFFITTGVKEVEGNYYLGQSRLSWLLGNEEKTEERPPEESGVKGTGEFVLDVVGNILVFLQKGQAVELLKHLSPEEALKSCSLAGDIIGKAMKSDEDKVEEIPEEYAMDTKAIEALRESGIDLPQFVE